MSVDGSVLRVDVYRNALPEHYTMVCDVLRVQHGDFDLGEVRRRLVVVVRAAAARVLEDETATDDQRAAAMTVRCADERGELELLLVDAERLLDERLDVPRLQTRLDEGADPG